MNDDVDLEQFEALDYRNIVAAVLLVHRENSNKMQQRMGGFVSSNPNWTRDSQLRQDLWTRACRAWVRITDTDFTAFPYSIDYVASVYDWIVEAGKAGRDALKRKFHKFIERAKG